MLADVIVLDRNPLRVPITDVGTTKVLLTLVRVLRKIIRAV